MNQNKQLAMSYLSREGIKFSEKNEDTISITWREHSGRAFPINVTFSDNGEANLYFVSWGAQLNFKGKEEAGYRVCNEVNKEYRWCKFYLDDDGDITCRADSYSPETQGDTLGKICETVSDKMATVLDITFETFRDAAD